MNFQTARLGVSMKGARVRSVQGRTTGAGRRTPVGP
jgi:hypothetical protein